MACDRFAEQPAGVERIAVCGGNDADFTLRNHRRLRHGNAEQVWMDGPQARRQRAQLDAFHTALFDERDRVLEVVVCVLRAIGSEDAPRRHRFTVNGFDDAHLVGTDLDQRHLANYAFKRKLDQVQPRLEHVGLNADLAFGSDNSSGRHFCAKVAPLFDRDFACADVHEDAVHDDEERDEEDKSSEHDWNDRC